MVLPNFLIIGAGKAATTSIANQLSYHPDIYIPSIKEPHFFDRNWDKGAEWYTEIFNGAKNEALIGEASVTYTVYPVSHDMPVPDRIKSLLGEEVKLLYIVRHPVDRLFSHYMHDILNSHISENTSLATALNDSNSYHSGSFYMKNLKKYLEHFKPEQIKVILFEDYVDKPREELKSIFEFLGADSEFEIADVEAKNVSSKRLIMPSWYLKTISLLSSPAIRRPLVKLLRIFGSTRLMRSSFGKRPGEKAITADEYNNLYEDFSGDIKELSDYLNKDLFSIWKKK